MAQADNILLLYRNYLDEALLSASSEAISVERLKDFRPSRFWRAEDCTAEHVLIDCGGSVNMTHGAVAAHNLDANGVIRCTVSDDPDIATDPDSVDLEYDSGAVEAWPPVAGFGSDGFGTSLGGYPLLTSINDYRPYRVFDFGGTVNARYVRYDFANPDLGKGIEVGRVFAGLGIQPERTFAYDWSWEWVDPSDVIDTEEAFFIVRRRKYRVLRISLPRLSNAEAMAAFDDLKRIVGRSRDLFVMLFPTGAANVQYRTTIYGVPIENGPIANPFFNVFSTSIAIRELAR